MGKFWQMKRPFHTLLQLAVVLVVLGAIFVAVDLNRRAQASQQVGVNEDALSEKVSAEATRSIELQATLTYVQSEDYVANYARNEGGYVLPGEKRVVPMVEEAPAAATPTPAPTPDPAFEARPWQAWWRLITDAPLPTR